MQSIEPQWKICQYSYSTIINHEILSREFLHLWDPLWIELKCSFRLFFNWNLSHMNFRLECFYEYFITKRTVIWKIKIITAATYGLKSGVEHEVMESLGVVELILVMNANADWFPGLINWIISPLLTGRAVCQWVRQWSWNLFDMIVNVVIVKRSLKKKWSLTKA